MVVFIIKLNMVHKGLSIALMQCFTEMKEYYLDPMLICFPAFLLAILLFQKYVQQIREYWKIVHCIVKIEFGSITERNKIFTKVVGK